MLVKPLWTMVMLGLAGCGDGDARSMTEEAEGEAGSSAGDAASSDASSGLTLLNVGDFTFQLRAAGPPQGEPVILLHGFPETSMEWEAQIAALASAGYRVAAPDQRGYSPGARPSAVDDYGMLALVQDLFGIADALGFERFHLVGHDWGASVAWVAAFVAPERLLSLTPVSVPHPDAFTEVLNDPSSCQPAASSYIGTFIADGAEAQLLGQDRAGLRQLYEGLPEERVDFYLEFFTDEGALKGGLNWYRAILGPGAMRFPLGATQVPTMYIWGDRDPALCRDGAELTGSYVAAPYRFEVLEGVGHWVPELAADRVNTLLLEHFSRNARDE
jgi:pimeloyl-ACP methyl ester carboxylesterase